MSGERWRMDRAVLDRFPDYGSEGCLCGTFATPFAECPLHFAIAEMERMEDETMRVLACALGEGESTP